VQEAGGETNARTDAMFTSFFFLVPSEDVKTTLDIFVEMIVNPKLEEDIIQPEIKSVHSEFSIKRLDENFRCLALILSFAKSDHPVGNFGMGTKNTLNVPNISEKLIYWKNQYYHAQNMTVVIQGSIPIPKLEVLTNEYFSRVPKNIDGKIPRLSLLVENDLNPFDPIKWHKLYKLSPALDQKWLKMIWTLPSTAWKSFPTKPIEYLHAIFNNKMEGSLDYYLRRKSWIISICSDCPTGNFFLNDFCTVFILTFELTDAGFDNYTEVIQSAFSYIKMLREKGPCLRIFKELQQMKADIFHYRSDSNITDPLQYFDTPHDANLNCVREFAEMLQYRQPPNRILLDKFLITHFDKQLIQESLDCLTPSSMCLLLASPDFENESNQKERWLKTKYHAVDISATFVLQLENIEISSSFYLPPPNPFVQDNICHPIDVKINMTHEDGHVFMDNGKVALTYLGTDCENGVLPTARYTADFHSPIIFNETEQKMNPIITLWTRLLTHYLDIKLATALNALITYDIYFGEGCIVLELRGPSHRLPLLFRVIVSTFAHLEEELEVCVFNNMAASLKSEYYNQSFQGENLSEDIKLYVLNLHHHTLEQCRQIILSE